MVVEEAACKRMMEDVFKEAESPANLVFGQQLEG
jgi:hypothetical protein